MRKSFNLLFVSLTASVFFFTAGRSDAREFSKSGTVYQDVKDGVLTVFSSSGYGSGFLVDADGLVLTNSHVVNNSSGHLRVKFGQNQVVEAVVLENDRDDDIAVIAINLANLKAKKALPLFLPAKEPNALPGEKVLTISSPQYRNRMEKALSEGVVSKLNANMIFHDAAIDHGSSGSPLLNFDGKVIGINTVSFRGFSGAINIAVAMPLIESARAKLKTLPAISPALLSDAPEIDYPVGKFFRSQPELFENRSAELFTVSTKYYTLEVSTPPQSFGLYKEKEESSLVGRKRRSTKAGFELSDDEFGFKNWSSWYNREPVVTMTVKPNTKETVASKVFSPVAIATDTAALVSGGTIARARYNPFIYHKIVYKKDFLRMELVDDSGAVVATPIESGRILLEESSSQSTGLSDKSYKGSYKFDPRVFETDKPLSLLVHSEGDEQTISIKIPESIKHSIVEDFKPYWLYVKELEAKGD